MTTDYILIEGNLDRIKSYVERIEESLHILITKKPTIGLTMVRAQDSVEHQEFYLGEVLVTECEVQVEDRVGSGLCIGDEPVRSYCLAVIDAIMMSSLPIKSDTEAFLEEEKKHILEQETEDQAMIQKTKVDFKLMEQS